jgi:hypothetical protein
MPVGALHLLVADPAPSRPSESVSPALTAGMTPTMKTKMKSTGRRAGACRPARRQGLGWKTQFDRPSLRPLLPVSSMSRMACSCRRRITTETTRLRHVLQLPRARYAPFDPRCGFVLICKDVQWSVATEMTDASVGEMADADGDVTMIDSAPEKDAPSGLEKKLDNSQVAEADKQVEPSKVPAPEIPRDDEFYHRPFVVQVRSSSLSGFSHLTSACRLGTGSLTSDPRCSPGRYSSTACSRFRSRLDRSTGARTAGLSSSRTSAKTSSARISAS